MIVADLHVIEFQQHGLPHAHILLILQSERKMYNSSGFDSIMCTEIPDKDSKPELFLVYMVDTTCTKVYPFVRLPLVRTKLIIGGPCHLSHGFQKSLMPM